MQQRSNFGQYTRTLLRIYGRLRRMGTTCSLSARACSCRACPTLLRLSCVSTRRRVQPSGKVLQRSLHLLFLEFAATLPCISMSRATQQIGSMSSAEKKERQLRFLLRMKCVTQAYGSGTQPQVNCRTVSTGLACPSTQKHLGSCYAMAQRCMQAFQSLRNNSFHMSCLLYTSDAADDL